jgi:hypothetical protein
MENERNEVLSEGYMKHCSAGESQFRNSSSVVERGIAGPKVTGSIPVCSFL